MKRYRSPGLGGPGGRNDRALDRALNFDPTKIGPVATAFFNSTAPVAAIMGPQGGAKTSTALMAGLRFACAWPRSQIDGVRYFRNVVIRDTYPNLEQTTLRSWHSWVPRSVGRYTAGAPHIHTLDMLHNGVPVHYEAIFRAVGDLDIEEVFRGFEPNMVTMDEADAMSELLLINALGRVRAGRHPGARHGFMLPGFVRLCFNAPDEDNWTYRRFVEALPEGWEFFRQPSGLSAQAENMAHLAPGYYAEMSKAAPDWWVRRFVRNEFGYSRDGKPVYPEFSDAANIAAAPLAPQPELPLVIGVDGGGTPAAVILQFAANGSARAIAELTSPPGTGAQAFAARILDLLARQFPEHDLGDAEVWHDPSADYGKTLGKDGNQSWIEIFAAASGLRCRPSRCNNDATMRLESLRFAFNHPPIDHQPALLISPACRELRRALNSKYRYRRKAIAGADQYEEKPDKAHPWSDVVDAAQYAYLNGAGVKRILDRRKAVAARMRPRARTERFADTAGLS